MPIAQERLIRLVAHSDHLITVFDDLQNLAKRIDLSDNAQRAENAISHTENNATKETIKYILSSLAILHDAISQINIPIHVRTNILEEKIHFKQHRKRNEHLARYSQIKRAAEQEKQLSLQQMPLNAFNAFDTPNAPDVSEAPEWTTQDALNNLIQQEPPAPKIDSGEIIYPKDYNKNNILPPGEVGTPLDVVQSSANANASAKAKTNPPAKKSNAETKPTLSRDPDIISNSLPDDLYDTPNLADKLL